MEESEKLPNVYEKTVTFKKESEREGYIIQNHDTKEPLVEISGYDLQLRFNSQYLKTYEDIKAACEGIRQMFEEEMLNALIGNTQQ